MPIYEYQCQECGHQLEAIQKFSDQPLLECPACDRGVLKKLVSASSFRLKGGGWYETDFKTKNKKQLAESTNAESGSEKSTPEATPAKTASTEPAKTSNSKAADPASKS
jgi:putative FmdB family regulatory protein